MIRLLLLFLFLSLSFSSLFAQKNHLECDSILNVIQQMPEDSVRLNKICDVIRAKQNTDDFLFYADLLLKEAGKQKNNQKICFAYYCQVVYYYNRLNLEGLTGKLDALKPIALNGKYYFYYFNGRRFLIELLVVQDDLEKAIDEGLKMRREAEELQNEEGIIAANLSLGTAYISSGRSALAIQSLEEALSLIDDQSISRLEIGLHIISVYFEKKDLKKCLTALNDLSKTLDRVEEIYPGSKEGYADSYFFMNVMFAHCYLHLGELSLATHYKELADKLFYEDCYFIYRFMYYKMRTDYYRVFGDIDRALAENEKAMNDLKTEFSAHYYERMYHKATLLREAGRLSDAMPYYKTAIVASDSISREHSHSQLKQIQANYNLEKALVKKEKMKRINRIVVLGGFIVLLLILLGATYKLFRLQQQIRRSGKETEKARQIVEEINTRKSLFMKNICHEIRTPLTSVVGFSELILDGEGISSSEKAHFSQEIKQNSAGLMSLINEVLDLSRLEVGTARFAVDQQDLLMLCRQAAFHTGECGTAEEISISTESGPIPVMTDSNRMIETIRSILYRRQESSETDHVQACKGTLKIDVQADKKQVVLSFAGSPLAKNRDESERISMRNQINGLFITAMNGEYHVGSPDTGEITIVYPLNV